VTIPFGLASFRMADFALWPFGRQLVKRTDSGVASTVGNIIRIVVAGSSPHRDCRRTGGDDHRHPAGVGQLDVGPGVSRALGRVIVPLETGQDPRYPAVR